GNRPARPAPASAANVPTARAGEGMPPRRCYARRYSSLGLMTVTPQYAQAKFVAFAEIARTTGQARLQILSTCRVAIAPLGTIILPSCRASDNRIGPSRQAAKRAGPKVLLHLGTIEPVTQSPVQFSLCA